MLPCVSPVPVILNLYGKRKLVREIGILRNRKWNPLKSKPRETKIGSSYREVRENGIPLYKHLAVKFRSKLTGITHLVKHGAGAIKRWPLGI